MKDYFRNASRTLAVLLCVTVMAFLGAFCVSASEADDESMDKVLKTGIGLTNTIVNLTQEDLAELSKSTDDFTLQAVEAWEGSAEELGAYVADAENEESTVAYKSGKYTVTVPQTFEKAAAKFVYIFDRKLEPASLTIDVKLPMGVTLARAAMNTLIGLCTVFLVLVFLSFVISLLKFVPSLVSRNEGEEVRVVPEPHHPTPVQEEEVEVDDGELIAVISAAIAAMEGTSADGFYVRSIRKVARR
ncbi:MAG: OadG family protein [Blautia sp.]|nr:OadG family protein [Blautia sp.]